MMGIHGGAIDNGIQLGPDGAGVMTVARPKKVTITAVVTRADGTVEDLGRVAYYNRNPVLNALGNAWIKIKERCR
jgi:hypothetical protein